MSEQTQMVKRLTENYMIHKQKHLASIIWRIPSFVCWWWGVGGREGGSTEWFS